MRDYRGVNYSLVEDLVTRRALSDIDYYLRDSSRGFARIQDGRVPDGSGAPLSQVIDLTDYLFLPGRRGGQTVHGLTADLSPTVVISNPDIGTTTTGALGTPVLRFISGPSTFTLQPILNNSGIVDFGVTIPFIGAGGNEAGFAVANTSANTSIRLVANAGAGTRSFIQAGAVNSGGSLINNNLTIGGFNSRTLARFALITTYGSIANADSSGTLTTDARIAINDDPFDYSGSAATSQPDALLVARRSTSSSGVPTLTVVAASSSQEAIGIRQLPTGTSPNKTIATPSLGGFRHDGQVILGSVGLLGVQGLNSVTTIATIVEASTGLNALGLGTQSAWSDSLATANSYYTCLGDTVSTHRAMLIASRGFGIFTRLGISSAYTLISNAQAGNAGFIAPEATPTVLRLVNAATGGADASVLLKLQTTRAGQSGDFLECIDSSSTTLASISATGIVTTPGLVVSDSSPFLGTITTGVGLTASRNYTLPDGGGTLVVAGNKVTLVGSTASTFDVTNSGTGTSFQDTGNNARKLRFVLSGASANNHSITLTNSGARNYGLGNLGGNVAIVGDQAPAVSAGRLGRVELAGQTANIASTNLSNTPGAGVYLVHVVAQCTTASGSGAPTLDFNLAWTDTLGATNRNATANPGETAFPLPLSTTGRTAATFVIEVASGNIAYSTTINAGSGTPQYAIHIRVESLG